MGAPERKDNSNLRSLPMTCAGTSWLETASYESHGLGNRLQPTIFHAADKRRRPRYRALAKRNAEDLRITETIKFFSCGRNTKTTGVMSP
ncbi:hypothetical protein BAUCODRAFT_32066 [Baudoinia panamericana UAMH 10762]|uniref:Uncharacterized protein n=1 Tax=Baudoinia panamericana (strain UAMH 10762) TaxID=717646 RepID=M2LU52_BAUPA|nr:uncharacterized protein BAUCODRAFT_32066 [Baudoinia panamericana UAMH 10762]EMC98067.1 hypothetical protein BAUCODRAFT_32066 [Baudoinia panamericana UAMH 10762]